MWNHSEIQQPKVIRYKITLLSSLRLWALVDCIVLSILILLIGFIYFILIYLNVEYCVKIFWIFSVILLVTI